jgi:alpha-beta hydrolase superfamily lysophospholipase
MKHKTFYFGGDNIKLFAQSWMPEKPKAIICLVHGIGEHSGRYLALAKDLTKAKYGLVAMDQRGHGQSEGRRGHTPSNESWMQDITCFITEVKKHFPNKNLFLYGHSLGGNQVLNYLLREKPSLKGAIVTSPAIKLGFQPPFLKILLGNVASKILPALSQKSGLNINNLTHDENVIIKYNNDPLVHDKVSAKTFTSFYNAGLWALNNADKLETNLLLMHGKEDRLTSPKATEEFAKKAGSSCTIKLWDNLYHELHNEISREKVVKYIIKWLDKYSL